MVTKLKGSGSEMVVGLLLYLIENCKKKCSQGRKKTKYVHWFWFEQCDSKVLMVGLLLTFQDPVVAEVQVKQEAHVQQCQRSTEQQPRRPTHGSGKQHRHLQHTHK